MKTEEKKHGLLKGILLLIFVSVILTWLIPNGELTASGFTEGIKTRVGLETFAEMVYNGIAFGLDKILLLFVLGGFYGVLSKLSAYERLVEGIAKKLSKHKKVTVVVFSVIIAAFTSILTQSFAILFFIPFIVAILKRMKLDKMSILATTFGSMLVGIMGATIGSDGLMLFDYYMGGFMKGSVWVRAGILAIGLILFNFFTLTHMDQKNDEKDSSEMFEIETKKEEKKRTIIPIIVIGILLLALVILGYMDWSGTLKVTCFDKFHTFLMEKTVGNDFFIFKEILGSKMTAFGTWSLFPIASIVLVFSVILGLCYRMKSDEFLTGFVDGCKKIVKPILCVVGAYTVMVIVYSSPYVATIMSRLFNLTDRFNVVTMSLAAFISSIFHTDLGYSSFVAGAFMQAEYVDYVNPIYTIFISLYGLVQFFVPTSILLGVGLTTLDVKYKDWLKYIWRFILGMLLCLLVIFVLMAMI